MSCPRSRASVALLNLANPFNKVGLSKNLSNGPRGVPENRKFLLEIDVKTSKKYSVQTHICLIRSGGGIGRDKRDVMSLFFQDGGHCIIMYAGSAVHASSTCGNIGNFHILDAFGFRDIVLVYQIYLKKSHLFWAVSGQQRENE